MAKVLFIVSGATYWVLKDGTRYRYRLLGRRVCEPVQNCDRCGSRGRRRDT